MGRWLQLVEGSSTTGGQWTARRRRSKSFELDRRRRDVHQSADQRAGWSRTSGRTFLRRRRYHRSREKSESRWTGLRCSVRSEEGETLGGMAARYPTPPAYSEF